MKQRVTFSIELQAGAEPPTEFCLFKAGPNKAHDGRGVFLFDALSATACMTHSSERGLDYVIDYEHASLAFISADPAESGKAAGWFKPEVRDGALYATNVQWTPKATEKLKAREYRYFSPAADFETTPDGAKRISKLINCALTNNPALAGIPPLMASALDEPPKEKPMLKALLSMLKLPENTAETEVVAAISRLAESHSALLSAAGAKTVDEASGLIAGWKASAAQVATLSAELTGIKAAAATREVDDLIETAKKDGRLSPASEKAARDVATSGGVASLKAMLSVLPKVGGRVEQPAGEGGTETFGLSVDELANCRKLKIDPEKFAAHKKASIASRTAAA